MGYLGATLTQVFTRARGADVSLRDVTIAQMGNGARECEWRHAPEARGGFGGFWKSQLSWVPGSEEDGWLSLARRSQASGLVAGAHVMGGGGADGKSRIERLCISLPYVETFNSKVIKGFVPELRSRYVFFMFRDSYVLCIYVMNIICTFHTYPYHGHGTEVLGFPFLMSLQGGKEFILYFRSAKIINNRWLTIWIIAIKKTAGSKRK